MRCFPCIGVLPFSGSPLGMCGYSWQWPGSNLQWPSRFSRGHVVSGEPPIAGELTLVGNFGQGTWQELQPIIISFWLFLGFLFLFAIHRWRRSNLCVTCTIFTWIRQFVITHRLKNVSAYNCRQKLNIFCIGILPKIVDYDGASS